MDKKINLIKLIFFFVVLFQNNAFAYIDPGTGGLLLQILVGIFASISIFFNKIKKFIKSLFNKNGNKKGK